MKNMHQFTESELRQLYPSLYTDNPPAEVVESRKAEPVLNSERNYGESKRNEEADSVVPEPFFVEEVAVQRNKSNKKKSEVKVASKLRKKAKPTAYSPVTEVKKEEKIKERQSDLVTNQEREHQPEVTNKKQKTKNFTIRLDPKFNENLSRLCSAYELTVPAMLKILVVERLQRDIQSGFLGKDKLP